MAGKPFLSLSCRCLLTSRPDRSQRYMLGARCSPISTTFATRPAIAQEIRPCRMCAADFAATATRHEPRPVVWLRQRARILIVGQAPGLRVHESGIPFDDRSGDRLREWLGVTRDEFYDRDRISILPMAFCFPGYHVNGSDLPPPPRCAATWRSRALDALNQVRLTILIGG